jgi:hypothetical protein
MLDKNDELPLLLCYDKTTIGEVVRWYVHKCRQLAVDNDFVGSKKIATDSEGFELIVRQFYKETNKHATVELQDTPF